MARTRTRRERTPSRRWCSGCSSRLRNLPRAASERSGGAGPALCSPCNQRIAEAHHRPDWRSRHRRADHSAGAHVMNGRLERTPQTEGIRTVGGIGCFHSRGLGDERALPAVVGLVGLAFAVAEPPARGRGTSPSSASTGGRSSVTRAARSAAGLPRFSRIKRVHFTEPRRVDPSVARGTRRRARARGSTPRSVRLAPARRRGVAGGGGPWGPYLVRRTPSAGIAARRRS